MPDNKGHHTSFRSSPSSGGFNQTKNIRRDDQAAFAREALYRAVREIDSKNKKRYNQIQKLRFLIYELQSLQPTDVNELSEALGQSQATTREQLKKLRKLDLVIRTRFEGRINLLSGKKSTSFQIFRLGFTQTTNLLCQSKTARQKSQLLNTPSLILIFRLIFVSLSALWAAADINQLLTLKNGAVKLSKLNSHNTTYSTHTNTG